MSVVTIEIPETLWEKIRNVAILRGDTVPATVIELLERAIGMSTTEVLDAPSTQEDFSAAFQTKYHIPEETTDAMELASEKLSPAERAESEPEALL